MEVEHLVAGGEAPGREQLRRLLEADRSGPLHFLNLLAYHDVEQDLIGDRAGWHRIAIMEYPSTDAFVEMCLDPDYAAALVHRSAGLAKTVVLVSRPLLARPRS